MPYVSRVDGNIKGMFALPQPGKAEEWLAADDPEVLQKKADSEASKLADSDARLKSIQDATTIGDLKTALVDILGLK